MPTTKARILAVCAAAVLTVPALSACSTYHDTYHDDTYHDRCDRNATANAFADPGDGAVTYDNTPDCGN